MAERTHKLSVSSICAHVCCAKLKNVRRFVDLELVRKCLLIDVVEFDYWA